LSLYALTILKKGKKKRPKALINTTYGIAVEGVPKRKAPDFSDAF
jgi:hypothetical protein